jgi:hypothetical protein
MATAVIDSIYYHRVTARGRTCLHNLYSTLIAAGIDVPNYHTKPEIATDGPNGVGAIAMGEPEAIFKDTRKVVLSLTSPLSLYAAIFKKITVHLSSYPINHRLLRIYHVPKPPLEGGIILPPKPIPHTPADLHHTDHPTTPVIDVAWASNGLPSQEKARPTRHKHITDRHKIFLPL